MAKSSEAATEEPVEPAQTKMGSPPVYKPTFAKQAEKLTELGATDRDLADFFGVAISTIGRWRVEHKEFQVALKDGKLHADERVKRSLYSKATGYSYEAVKIFMPAGADEPVYAPYVEHVPPDTTAAIFWLKNRDKANWRDRHELSGADGQPLVQNNTQINIGMLTPEARENLKAALLEAKDRGDGE